VLEDEASNYDMVMSEIKDTRRKLNASIRILEEVKDDEMNRGTVWYLVDWVLRKEDN
jgi:hypothetical protein